MYNYQLLPADKDAVINFDVIEPSQEIAGVATRKVWICGELSDEWDGIKTSWIFQGLFSTRAMSVQACKTEKYFIFSAMANEEKGIEPLEALDLCFPLIEADL